MINNRLLICKIFKELDLIFQRRGQADLYLPIDNETCVDPPSGVFRGGIKDTKFVQRCGTKSKFLPL